MEDLIEVIFEDSTSDNATPGEESFGNSIAIPKRRKLLCGHCDCYLPKTTYYRHRSNFYNLVTKKWTIQSDVQKVLLLMIEVRI